LRHSPLGQKAVEKGVEKGAEKLGEKGVEGLLPQAQKLLPQAQKLLPQAQKLWAKLHPQVEAKAAAEEAAVDVAKAPDDADALAALRQQLKKILEAPENAALVQELTAILAEDPETAAGGAKFNVQVKDSQVGAIGDRATVTMHIGTKPQA
jgi:hypothetical protein